MYLSDLLELGMRNVREDEADTVRVSCCLLSRESTNFSLRMILSLGVYPVGPRVTRCQTLLVCPYFAYDFHINIILQFAMGCLNDIMKSPPSKSDIAAPRVSVVLK